MGTASWTVHKTLRDVMWCSVTSAATPVGREQSVPQSQEHQLDGLKEHNLNAADVEVVLVEHVAVTHKAVYLRERFQFTRAEGNSSERERRYDIYIYIYIYIYI